MSVGHLPFFLLYYYWGVEYVRNIEGKQSVYKDILKKIKESAKEANDLVNKFNEKDLQNINGVKDDCAKKLAVFKK